jgi:hypothetical protein
MYVLYPIVLYVYMLLLLCWEQPDPTKISQALIVAQMDGHNEQERDHRIQVLRDFMGQDPRPADQRGTRAQRALKDNAIVSLHYQPMIHFV